MAHQTFQFGGYFFALYVESPRFDLGLGTAILIKAFPLSCKANSGIVPSNTPQLAFLIIFHNHHPSLCYITCTAEKISFHK
jgi:hypothetical protein